MPTLFCETEGHIVGGDKRERLTNPAQSETPGTLGNSMRENRETLRPPAVMAADRGGKSEDAIHRCTEQGV